MYYLIKCFSIVLFFLWSSAICFGQGSISNIQVDGQVMTIFISDEGDTLHLASDLEEVTLTSFRKFKNNTDRRRYYKYRRYALKVYPFAVKAIKIFREMEVATATMKKRKRRKYIKKLQKEYDDEFRPKLKKLTRTQGKILIKMIEKELDSNFYDLLKELRGSFNARIWQTTAKFYKINLKDGYIKGEDEILDVVLGDLNISYDSDY